jgi:hypothetical protein
MATVTVCDVCKKEIRNKGEVSEKFTEMTTTGLFNLKWDLCEPCGTSLANYLRTWKLRTGALDKRKGD